MLISKPLEALFNPDPQVNHYTMQVMKYILSLYWLFGINEVFGGALRGAGRSMVPMLVTLICMSGFRVLWIYGILPFKSTFDFMLLAYPLSWIITFLAYIIYMKKADWLPVPEESEKYEETETTEAGI